MYVCLPQSLAASSILNEVLELDYAAIAASLLRAPVRERLFMTRAHLELIERDTGILGWWNRRETRA